MYFHSAIIQLILFIRKIYTGKSVRRKTAVLWQIFLAVTYITSYTRRSMCLFI